MAQPTFDDVKLQFDSIVGDFRTNKTTWEKSRFDLDVLLKGPDFDLNDEERKDLIDRAVGRYNVDAMTQGNTGGILDIAGSFVPKSLDYVSAVIDESPKQLSNFDTQFAKSVYGIAQSYYEDDPDPKYLQQRTYGGVPKVSPDLAQQGVNDALQKLPSAVGGGIDPLPFAEERNAATEYLKGLATRAGDAFVSGAESLIDLKNRAIPENYDEYLGGAAPKYATREEVEARVKDNIRRSVENTQKAISERLAEKIAELEEDPLPPAYTAFGKGFASLGESIVTMGPALLATVPGARYPSMYLSNDVAAQMVASEARQDFLQDELWLEMSKNMTDLEKQNALSEILPIVSFEAKTMRKGFSDAAAADLAAMFPTGSIKVALSLDVAGGGVSEMFDTDIVGVAARRALKYYADKNNLPISSDPRINLVNRYDYIRANPEKALESLKTGMVMSGVISTPSSLIDAYRIKKSKTKGKNQNANPAQIEALTNTVLQKLQTIDPKNQKQVEDTVAYITRINPLGVNVVEELNTLVEQGGTLSDTQKELLKLYNKLPAFLDAPIEEGPTTAAEDVLATGPANMTEYYDEFTKNLTSNETRESFDYGTPSTDAQARQRGAELAAADGPEDTSGLLPTPDTIIPPLPQPESDLNLTEPIGPELKLLDDSAIVRESKRKRKLGPGQALKKAQKKGFQTEEDRNIAEVMEEFYNDLGSQRFPERFNETGDLDSLESSRENSEEIAIDRAIRAEDQFRAAQEDQERRLNDQLSVLPKDSELRKKLEDIKKQRREAQKQTDAILKADEQIEQRDFNANQKQLRKEALAREALANQQKIVEIEDTMRGLEEAAEKAKKSQSTIKEQDRVFDQDILADLDQRIADQREAEEALEQQTIEGMTESVEASQAAGKLTPRQATRRAEAQAEADFEADQALTESDMRVQGVVQELLREEQQQLEGETTSELEALDSITNLIRPVGERLREVQDAAAQTERVQRIFDTENTTRSEVGNGLTINPETPRGAQILKERELEVLKDVLEQEYPGATKVDMVASEAEAAALLPEGVSAEGQEGVMYSDSEGIKIVLIGQNIENKQVFDGTPADSRQALLTNAIRDGVRIYFHESLGHAGLRQAFGNNEAALQDFFGRIYGSNRQDEINSWGTERYGADAWETMPSAEKAEEWLVQNFVEEGVRPSGILDSIRLFFGADNESSDPAIRQLVNDIHDSLRQGRKPTIVRSAVGAQTTVAEEPPVEEVSVPTEQQSVPNEGASVEQDTPSVTPPVTPSNTSLDSVFRSAYEKGITPPSKSMITARKKKFFMERPFLKDVDLNEMDVNLIQGMIKAAQDEIDSIMNPVNLEMINNPATRRARKLTAAQRNKVRGLLADIQTMQEILGSAPVAPVAQTDQATPEATPETAPVQATTESTSVDVQPIVEETPEEAARSGSAVRMSGRGGLRPTMQEVKQLEAERKEAPGYQTPRQQQEASTNREDLAAEARRYIAGEIEYEDFQAAVQRLNPIESLGIKYDIPGGVPAPATTEEIQDAVGIKSQGKVLGADTEIADGTDVGLRLDINAYQNKDVWVPTIHDGKVRGTQGKVLAYAPVARVLGHSSDGRVSFESNPDAALNIASGKINKTTIARVFGSFQNANPEELFNLAQEYIANPKQGDDVWVEVGMDPTRGSFFYDKATGDPVLTSDEAIQVGALVLAKNPEYGNVNDIRTVGRTKGIPAGLRFSSGRRPLKGQVIEDRTVLDPAALKMIDDPDLQEALKDEGMFLFMWDRMRADGEYVTPGGQRFKLEGGPMNPHMAKNVAAGIIGASTPDFFSSVNAAIARSNGYGVPVLMSPDAHQSNQTFFDIYNALLQESFKANRGMKKEVVDHFAKTFPQRVASMIKEPSKKDTGSDDGEKKSAILRELVKVAPEKMLDAYIKAAPNISFEARKQGLLALGMTKASRDLGTPNITDLTVQLADPEYVNVPVGAATSILKFDKNEPLILDPKGRGLPSHRSYGMLFKGNLVGKFKAPVPLETMLGQGMGDLKSNTEVNKRISAKVEALKKKFFRDALPTEPEEKGKLSLQDRYDKLLEMDAARQGGPESSAKTFTRLMNLPNTSKADRQAIANAKSVKNKEVAEQQLAKDPESDLSMYESNNRQLIGEVVRQTPSLVASGRSGDIPGKIRSGMPPVNDPAQLKLIGEQPSPGPALDDLRAFIGKFTRFKNSRHVRAFVDAVNGTFQTPTADEFQNAFTRSEAARVGALSPHSNEELESPAFKTFQLGGRRYFQEFKKQTQKMGPVVPDKDKLLGDTFDVFFALHDHSKEGPNNDGQVTVNQTDNDGNEILTKRGKPIPLKDKDGNIVTKPSRPWYDGFFETDAITDNEVELVSVMNNEPDLLSGVGTGAILLKAVEEGATILDAFAVKSQSKPDGLLPTLYGRYGFETIGTIPFAENIWRTDQGKRLGVESNSPEINELFDDLKSFWSEQGWNEADGNPDVVVMKWTGRRENGSRLDRNTIRQEIVKPTTPAVDGGPIRRVLPSPPEQPLELVSRTSEDQDTGGDNTGVDTGDAGDRGAVVRSGETSTGSVLKPDSFQKGVQAVRDLDPQVYEATGAPVLRFSSKRLSAKESAAQEFAKTTLVPNTVLRNMLGHYPEYMDGVVQHMTNLRNKWQAGQMKPRDVAKAYWITIASIGSAATKFENAQNYFDTTIPDAFASYNKNGVKMVRPEEFAAFWFTTPIGQRALDAIDQGRVDKDAFDDLVMKRQRAFGRFDMTKPDGRYFPKPLTAGTRRVQGIDPKTNKPKQQNVPITPFGATIPSPNLDGSRPGVMSDINPTGDLFSESLGRPKEGAYGVRDMYEIAQRINQKPGDKAVLKEELGKLTGIGEFGKLPFISHFFGVGDAITMDARELNFWITGEVDTSRLTEAKNKGKATPEELQKLETLRKFKQNDELKRLLNQEILNRMQELQRQGVIPANLTVDDLGEVGHHWIWDASEGDVTTHEGTYLTMTRFSSARRRPLQNNPQGRTKDQQAARGALNALQTFFDTKTNMPEREFFEELKQAARGKMSAYVEAGRDLGNLFMKAKPIEQALIYQYLIDPNGSPTSIPNRQVGKTDLRQAAIDAKGRIEKIGEDLVRLGMLDPQVFENRKGQYLPRIYLKHLFSEEHQKILSSGGSLKTSDLGYLKKMKDIDALIRESVLGEIKSPGYLVSRVLMQSGQDIAKMDFLKALSRNQNWVLPESYVEISYGNEIENILNANPSLRRQLLNEGLPPAARQTAVRRVTPEYLASEARRLRDAVIPYKQGASKKLAEDLASVMEQKVSQARGSQDYDPLNYTKLPDSARYGDLRGAVVRNEIYDEFVGSPFANNQTKIEEAIGVITSLMKFNLTAANPVVWANNLRSNTAMMHFAGLPVHRNIQYRWKALKEVLLNRSRYKAFKDQGLTLSTFAANELGKLETQLALSLSPADRKILARPIRFSKPVLMGQSVWAFIYNKLGGLYQMMEVIDKLALGMYLEDHGPSTGIPLANGKKMSTAAAMREANKWLFDYSDVPDSIRRYRKSVLGAPFITWAYKATPQLLGMMKKPTGWLRAGTWYGLLHMVMASQEADLDDEEYDAYYASLPDWLAQRDYFSIPLPMRDENGMMVTEDYTMFAPHAMLMNLGTTAFLDAAGAVVPDEMLSDKARRFNLVDEAKALGFASHPLLESTMELVHNRDSFTGKPIYYDTDTTGDFNAKVYEHFADNLYPQLVAPNGFARKLIELSVDDPNIFGPSSVLDKQGNPTRTLGQQARRAIPLVPNQYPSDPQSNLGYRMADIQKAMKEEAKKYAANRRKYKGDKETLRKITEEHRAEMDRLRRLMREFPRAGDLPRLQEYAG